jgi:hypothetical protein
VLGLAIADTLYAAFTGASEGELPIRLAALVRREACAKIAGKMTKTNTIGHIVSFPILEVVSGVNSREEGPKTPIRTAYGAGN